MIATKECRCASELAVMLRQDDKSLPLSEAVSTAKLMLVDDPSLHECGK